MALTSTDTAAPFVWGSGGGELTEDQIAARRRAAAAMMKTATDTSPVQHWTQGAARVLQGVVGALMDRDADASQKAADDTLISAATGGGVAPFKMGYGDAVPASAPASATTTASLPEGADGMHKTVFDGLVARGLSPTLAAGAAGNFGGESSFNTGAWGDKGTSFGLAQWRGPRLDALRQLAAAQGKDPSDVNVQLDHFVGELNGPENRAFRLASAAQTPEEAAHALAQHYERPAAWALQQSSPKRQAIARQFFDRFGGAAPAGPVQVASADPSFAPGAPAAPVNTTPSAPALGPSPDWQTAQATPAGFDAQLATARTGAAGPVMPQPMMPPPLANALAGQGKQYAQDEAGNIVAPDPNGGRPSIVFAAGNVPQPPPRPSGPSLGSASAPAAASPSPGGQPFWSDPDAGNANDAGARSFASSGMGAPGAQAIASILASRNPISAPAAPVAPSVERVAAAVEAARGGQGVPGANAAPSAGATSGLDMSDPRARVGIALIRSGQRAAGISMLAGAMEGNKVQYQTLPDGTILALDPRGRAAPKPVYQAQTKPTYGVIGTDPNTGEEIRGFIDTNARTVTPASPMGGQPAQPSTIPTPPPGVDPKVWRKEQSERATANALPAKFDDTTKVRQEVQSLPSYKNFAQAAPIYRGMAKTAGTATKASDLNLVYGLGKIMDPGSVVREGEMVMVKNTASLPDWFQGVIAAVSGGAQLTPETRQKIMAEAHGRLSSYEEQFGQDAETYRGIAKRNRMNEADVIPDFGKFEPWQAPPIKGATPGVLKAGETTTRGAVTIRRVQ